ncbi:UNVERIFIED_CONTAM: hypothetical protein K2H54_038715 [Gekko kuhli]
MATQFDLSQCNMYNLQLFIFFINLFLIPADYKGLSVQGMHCCSSLGNRGYAGSCQRKLTCANLRRTLSRISFPHSILLTISFLLVTKTRNFQATYNTKPESQQRRHRIRCNSA